MPKWKLCECGCGLSDLSRIHGTVGGNSNHHCKCKPCREAYNKYRKAHRQDKAKRTTKA